MAVYRSAYTVDASIWIDLEEGELLDHLFRLPVDWYAPVQEVLDLASRYRRPSRVDLFALVLAKSLGIGLLTGDRSLRLAAESEGIEVHGTLWVLDEMVSQQVLTAGEAADALERMLAGSGRFPEAEVEARLQRWRAKP